MKTHRNPFAVLRFRDFRLLWTNLLISQIGSQMQVVAVVWHVYLLTKSPLSLGIIGLVRFIPLIFLSLFSGMIADRFDRKKIMLFSQLLMALSALILTITTFTNQVSPTLIYFSLVLASIGFTFDMPARQSLIPQLVPKEYLMGAIGLNSTLWQIAFVLGPSLGGFAIAAFGIGSIYLINTVSFLPIILGLLLMKSYHNNSMNKTSLTFAAIKEGIAFIKSKPLIYSTMILDFFATFFSSATVLLPIFAKDILAVGPKGLGILYAAPAIGGIFAGLITSSFHRLRNQGKILLIAVILYGVATALFGISHSFYLSILFLALTGIGDVVSAVIRNTIRQLATPDHIRGRMTSINMIFFMGGPQLGEVEAGFLAAAIGTPMSVVVGGVGTVIATLIIAACTPRLRKYQGDEVIV